MHHLYHVILVTVFVTYLYISVTESIVSANIPIYTKHLYQTVCAVCELFISMQNLSLKINQVKQKDILLLHLYIFGAVHKLYNYLSIKIQL